MKIRILIIELDNLFRENLAQRLKLEGFKVQTTSVPAKAPAIVKRQKINIVLLSLVELKRKGLESMSAIKEIQPAAEIIVINSQETMDLAIESMKMGAFEDFYLPLDMRQVLRSVNLAGDKIKKNRKLKKSLLQRYEEMTIAISLAEAGALTLAHDYLNREDRNKLEPLKQKQVTEQTKKYKGVEMEQIKLLLVDDEEELVKTLSARMAMRNFGTDIALNGEEALKIVDNEVPDVMVLDLKMPGIDGMEVLKRVKRLYPKIQVIILTGHGSDQDEKNALESGAYAYLNKPIDIDLLVSTIKDAYLRKVELQEAG